MALEEFVMIVGKMSSIILSPAAQAAWRETGYERWECKETGRMVAVGLLIAGVKWRFVSVYAPDSETSMGERIVLGESTALA